MSTTIGLRTGRHRQRGPTRRILRVVGQAIREAPLSIAALGGAVCIVLTVLAFTGGYSLIMFKTGSMSPTIPAGSVALVREIPRARSPWAMC